MNPPKQVANGDKFGCHRVIEPSNVLPQPAQKLDNDFSRIWDNEILLDVTRLNIDSASFTQLKKASDGDLEHLKKAIFEIVEERGKMQNPVTGSGGVLIGTVAALGDKMKDKDLKVGDRVVTLVSLSLTPLKLEEILEVRPEVDQVDVRGQAVLFESGLYAKLPSDIPENLALAVLDVCGAPAQTAKLVHPEQTVIIMGAGGKSGILSVYAARQELGPTGRLIGVEFNDEGIRELEKLDLCDDIIKLDATDSIACYEGIKRLTEGKMADIVINCVNIPNTEMASILMTKNGGLVYFFSMATSFTKAALGAEGVGMDVTMLIGNGYTKGHAELALNILKESPQISALYERLYA